MDNLKIIYPRKPEAPTIFYADGTPIDGVKLELIYDNDWKLLWEVEYTQPYSPSPKE